MSEKLGKALISGIAFTFFIGTAVMSKNFDQKGWLIGIGVATTIVLLSWMFYTIGIDVPLTFKFVIRSLITFVICITGGMIGVNLPNNKRAR